MRKVWLLGFVAAAVMVAGSMMATYAEEGAPPPKGERKAGEGRPEGRRPEVAATPDQLAKMQDHIKGLEDAIKALEAKAVEVLGPLDGRRFLMQTIMKSVRPAGEGRPEGKAGEGRKPRGDRKPAAPQ